MYKIIYEKTKEHVKLDIVEMLVAEYLISSSKNFQRLHNDRDYFWVAHARLIRDLPELSMNVSKVYRVINNLIDAGLVVRHSDSSKLQRTYYKLTDLSVAILKESKKATKKENSKEVITKVKKAALPEVNPNNNCCMVIQKMRELLKKLED